MIRYFRPSGFPVRLGTVAAVAAALGAQLFALIALERLRPLRHPTQSRASRLVVNGGVASAAVAALSVAYPVIVFGAAGLAARYRLGLFNRIALARGLRSPLAFVLLDLSLWAWHHANHRLPLLWRFHAAHHADLDLDASTALRFHPGEQLLSMPLRAAQLLTLGVPVPTFLAWEAATLFCTQFHHSNVFLPRRLEQWLGYVLATPRLHSIHHSIVAHEVNSNYGTIFSIWDRAFKTYLGAPGRAEVVVGLARFRAPLSLAETLALPIANVPLPVPG